LEKIQAEDHAMGVGRLLTKQIAQRTIAQGEKLLFDFL
jgi:hypothetical protein